MRTTIRLALVGLVAAGLVAAAAVPAVAAPSSSYPKGINIFESTSPAVNFTKEAQAGTRFVYIKASGGVSVTNDLLKQQWDAAGAAGIIRGAYHLAAPNLPTADSVVARAKAQADHFAAQGALLTQKSLWSPGGDTLPPVLDIEKNDPATQQANVKPCFGLSQADMRTWVKAFLAEAQAKIGRAPIIYAGDDFVTECLGSTTTFAGTQLWKASYGSSVGTIPSGFASWTFWHWQRGDFGNPNTSKAYDRDVFNGTPLSLRLLADPTYGAKNVAATRRHDYNGDKATDILAATSGGALYDYRGNGAGGFVKAPANVQIASGLTAYNAFAAVGAATSSGNPGLYARGNSGTLYYFPVSPKGYLGTRVTAATGWSGMTRITSAGDFTGDQFADLLAVDKVGVLWLYVGAGNGTFSGRVQLGTGWNSKSLLVGGSDFSGDGFADLVARDASGGLALYSHTPTVAGLTKTTIPGTDWNNYTKIFTPGDFTGDKKADLMAIGKSGQMYVFPGTSSATNPFPVRKAVGTTKSWGTRSWLG